MSILEMYTNLEGGIVYYDAFITFEVSILFTPSSHTLRSIIYIHLVRGEVFK